MVELFWEPWKVIGIKSVPNCNCTATGQKQIQNEFKEDTEKQVWNELKEDTGKVVGLKFISKLI